VSVSGADVADLMSVISDVSTRNVGHCQYFSTVSRPTVNGKSSESVQCTMLKACDACADMSQL